MKAVSSQTRPKGRSRSWDCAVCGKPIRKGASLELREWTRCEGFQTNEAGDRGMVKGVGIILFSHARCSKELPAAIVPRLDQALRRAAFKAQGAA